MSKKNDPWADEENWEQGTFDDFIDAEERKEWMKRRRCMHCYVWAFDASTQEFLIACAHGCGSIRNRWTSVDFAGDTRRVKSSQEAFMISHRNGCPRRSPMGKRSQGPASQPVSRTRPSRLPGF
jgi:hypothetical protein